MELKVMILCFMAAQDAELSHSFEPLRRINYIHSLQYFIPIGDSFSELKC